MSPERFRALGPDFVPAGDAVELPLIVCGWRVVRRLPSVPGRERMLACLPHPESVDAWHRVDEAMLSFLDSPIQPGELAEVLRDLPAPGVISLDEELQLLSQLQSDHVPTVLDSSVDADGRTMVARERTDFDASELVTFAPLEAGEVVSLIAPIVDVLIRAHRAGIGHGAVCLSSVSVTADGCPILGGWESASRIEYRDRSRPAPQVAADWRGIATMVDALTQGRRTRVPMPGLLRSILDQCESTDVDDETGAALLDAIFEWSPGAPIPSPDEPRAPSPRRRASSTPVDAAPAGTPRRRIAIPAGARDAAKRFREEMGRVRKPVWVAAGISACVLTASLAFVTFGRSSAADAQAGDGPHPVQTSAHPSHRSAAPDAVSTSPGGAEQNASDSGGQSLPTEPSSGPTAAGESGVSASESAPVAASALMQSRHDALVSGDVRVLERIYSPGAPGLERDLAALQAASGQEPVSTEGIQWTVVDEFASVTMVASVDGRIHVTIESDGTWWRIRSVQGA